MPTERFQDKSNTTGRKPTGTRPPAPPKPQIQPPLLIDGVEAVRDSHC